jgi:hypothetical protein
MEEAKPATFKSARDLAQHVVLQFEMYEDREFVVHTNREVALLEWFMDCLTNPRNEWAQEVLNIFQAEYEDRAKWLQGSRSEYD